MSDSIMIRKAKQDYVCSCCGHIIRKGDEYLDKVILNVGKIVKHDRYHDECPVMSPAEKVFRKIAAANGDLIMADDKGNKYHLIGVRYFDGVPKVVYQPWQSALITTYDFVWLKDCHDEKGDPIL